MRKRGLSGLSLLCLSLGLYVGAFTSLIAFPTDCLAADESKIVYRLIGAGRPHAKCPRNYLVTIFETGKVVYEGRACVRELGVREYSVSPELAQAWIGQLRSAGVLDLPAEIQPIPQDALLFQLELVTAGRRNTIRYSATFSRVPKAAVNVTNAIRREIDPYQRWACMPGQRDCLASDQKVTLFKECNGVSVGQCDFSAEHALRRKYDVAGGLPVSS